MEWEREADAPRALAPPGGGGRVAAARAAGRPCRGVEEELSVRGGERGAAAAAA